MARAGVGRGGCDRARRSRRAERRAAVGAHPQRRLARARARSRDDPRGGGRCRRRPSPGWAGRLPADERSRFRSGRGGGRAGLRRPRRRQAATSLGGMACGDVWRDRLRRARELGRPASPGRNHGLVPPGRCGSVDRRHCPDRVGVGARRGPGGRRRSALGDAGRPASFRADRAAGFRGRCRDWSDERADPARSPGGPLGDALRARPRGQDRPGRSDRPAQLHARASPAAEDPRRQSAPCAGPRASPLASALRRTRSASP